MTTESSINESKYSIDVYDDDYGDECEVFTQIYSKLQVSFVICELQKEFGYDSINLMDFLDSDPDSENQLQQFKKYEEVILEFTKYVNDVVDYKCNFNLYIRDVLAIECNITIDIFNKIKEVFDTK